MQEHSSKARVGFLACTKDHDVISRPVDNRNVGTLAQIDQKFQDDSRKSSVSLSKYMTHEASLENSRILGIRAIKLNLENFFWQNKL